MELVLSESLFPRDDMTGCREVDEGELPLLDLAFTRIPVPSPPDTRWYAGDEVVLRVHRDRVARVRGATAEAVDRVLALFPGDWTR
ncbi:hypothetical protein [Saccharothrix sp. Mg75]|uniref:hypothetical protein n=1 Tax=Saccharothrix sp. Mg75 TaxID=3445357 RepID=UPI003EEEA82E